MELDNLTRKEVIGIIQDIVRDIHILEMRHYNASTRSEKIKCTKEINKLKAKQREICYE